jgi:selenocysteine lyase/cysteine desulfurase
VEPVPCQREQFDLPRDVAYLNAAYMGPLSHDVVAAGESGLRAKARPWEIVPRDFFSGSEAFREAAARLIGGDAEGIAIVPAVSYGVALATRNLPVPPGGRIVVPAGDFPSDVDGWRAHAAACGAEVVTIARPGDDDWTSAVLAAIDAQVRIVAVPNCHWADGALFDLVRIGDAARAVGAALAVDVTQSLGALPVDVAVVRPDVLVCAGYKWLLGPYSTGFAWFAPPHRAGTPVEHNWIARKGSEDFARLVDDAGALQPGARRYDVGERANFALLPAATEAFNCTSEWGQERIGARCALLNERIAAGAEQLGLVPVALPHRAPHLLGLRLPGGAPEDLAARLAAARVYVSVRGDAVRVSPHVYNDEADADRLLEVLADAVGGR